MKMTNLTGRGDDITMLAIRADNLNVIPFANRSGNWHSFEKYADLIPEPVTRLTIGDNYASLLEISVTDSSKEWFTGTRLTLDEAKEVLEWRTMTCGVLICHKNGRWGNSTPRDEAVELFNALQIVSNNGAFECLGVMVWPSYHRCSEPWMTNKSSKSRRI
uniref:rRNA N-glycosylase n=1 Tax=Oryza barthii TaxID=65489 RepID=A0A0D3FMD0_9ORYZ